MEISRFKDVAAAAGAGAAEAGCGDTKHAGIRYGDSCNDDGKYDADDEPDDEYNKLHADVAVPADAEVRKDGEAMADAVAKAGAGVAGRIRIV